MQHGQWCILRGFDDISNQFHITKCFYDDGNQFESVMIRSTKLSDFFCNDGLCLLVKKTFPQQKAQ